MALLALQTQGVTLRAERGALVVRQDNKLLRRVPLHEVTEVHLYGAVELHSSARDLLLRERVDVLLLSRRGLYRGRMVPPGSAQASRRCAQYTWLASEANRLALGRAIVIAKLASQRQLLAASERPRPQAVVDALAALRRAAQQAATASSLDALRGWEGSAARLYYAGFAATLRHSELRMNGRSRRPPKDEVNACLSFGYMLTLRRVESAVRRAGLDVYLGALHGHSRDAPALALDLLEELRAPVVDRVVRRLINRHQLEPADFEAAHQTDLGAGSEAPAGVYLGPSGRETLLRALGAAWRARVPDPWGHGRVELTDGLYRQAMSLSRWFEGEREGYSPMEF